MSGRFRAYSGLVSAVEPAGAGFGVDGGRPPGVVPVVRRKGISGEATSVVLGAGDI